MQDEKKEEMQDEKKEEMRDEERGKMRDEIRKEVKEEVLRGIKEKIYEKVFGVLSWFFDVYFAFTGEERDKARSSFLEVVSDFEEVISDFEEGLGKAWGIDIYEEEDKDS